jgi:hypothetical protein
MQATTGRAPERNRFKDICLRIGFVVADLFGPDKFFNQSVDRQIYFRAPINRPIPGSPNSLCTWWEWSNSWLDSWS